MASKTDETRAAVDNGPWDAGAAMSFCAQANDPASAYAAICAGRKAGDPALQSSWALPHHAHPKSPPNAAAVRAGEAALGGARGGVQGLTNRAAAQAHLDAHMKQINPDYQAKSAESTGETRADDGTMGYQPAPYRVDPDELVPCPVCGKMNDSDAHFCDQCDAELPGEMAYAPDSDELVRCPSCYLMNDVDARFCDQCGYQLEGSLDVVVLDAPRSARPPRDNLVRAMFPGVEVRAADEGKMPTLIGHFAVFNQWTKIDSAYEGTFMERIAPGAFRKTFAENRDQLKVTFQHGKDPQLGDKPLGPISVLEEDDQGARYEVPLLDTAYNRELIPGLQANLYGSSFRFQVVKEDFENKPTRSAYNPDGLPERTVREASVLEFGPVTYPAYPGATAGVRSMTDQYLVERLTADPERFTALLSTVTPALTGPDPSATMTTSTPDPGAEPEAHSSDESREPVVNHVRRFRSREDWIKHLESLNAARNVRPRWLP
jgi:HK97 family phage prohead protease